MTALGRINASIRVLITYRNHMTIAWISWMDHTFMAPCLTTSHPKSDTGSNADDMKSTNDQFGVRTSDLESLMVSDTLMSYSSKLFFNEGTLCRLLKRTKRSFFQEVGPEVGGLINFGRIFVSAGRSQTVIRSSFIPKWAIRSRRRI